MFEGQNILHSYFSSPENMIEIDFDIEKKREISLFVFGIYGDWEKPQRGKRISGCKSISTNCVTKNHYYNDDDDNNNNDDDSRHNSHTIFIERMKK